MDKQRGVCHLTFNGEVVLNLPYPDSKIQFILMDGEHPYSRSIPVKTKHLARGVNMTGRVQLDGNCIVHITLCALDFGVIEKPSTKPSEAAKPMPGDEYLRTAAASQSHEHKKKRLRDFKPHEIKRNLPAIAAGSFGIVYCGSAKGLKGMVVAIKDIKVTNNRLIEEWRKEIEFMAVHSCPYIVEVFGFSATPAVLTIVMEFAEKGTLFHLLHKGDVRVPLLTRVRMARHIAMAIAFLHANRVIHRDIKSLNVLITRYDVAKLSDFGTAKVVGTDGMDSYKTMAAALWMAPEVRTGHSYNLSADIFSLGVLLYELFEHALPTWDPQNQTIVLPSYKFPSAPLVLPLINLNSSKRPSSSLVAKQMDNLLGCLITGSESLSGTGAVVDLDVLHSIDDQLVNDRFVRVLAKLGPPPAVKPSPSPDASQAQPSPRLAALPASSAPPVPPRPRANTNDVLRASTGTNPFARPAAVPQSGIRASQPAELLSPRGESAKKALPKPPGRLGSSPPPDRVQEEHVQHPQQAPSQASQPLQIAATPLTGGEERERQPSQQPPSGTPKRATMLYAYSSGVSGHLEVTAGTSFTVGRITPEWIEGILPDGRRGWVPATHVKFLSDQPLQPQPSAVRHPQPVLQAQLSPRAPQPSPRSQSPVSVPPSNRTPPPARAAHTLNPSARVVVAWVEPKYAKPLNDFLLRKVVEESPDVCIVPHANLDEFARWLVSAETSVPALALRLRVVTCGFRESNGHVVSAEKIVKFMEKHPKLSKAPILVFCSNIAAQAHLTSRAKVSSVAEDFISFCTS